MKTRDKPRQDWMVDGGPPAQPVRIAAQQQQEAAPPAAAPEDRMAKIKELGEMKSQGLLTDEEFAAEKARILAT